MSESQQEPEICHVIGAKRYWQGGRFSRLFNLPSWDCMQFDYIFLLYFICLFIWA